MTFGMHSTIANMLRLSRSQNSGLLLAHNSAKVVIPAVKLRQVAGRHGQSYAKHLVKDHSKSSRHPVFHHST